MSENMTYEQRIKREHERFKVGDRVRHSNTKQWGVVTEVRPVHYGVELVVDRVVEDEHNMTGKGYWEGIRIDHHTRDGKQIW